MPNWSYHHMHVSADTIEELKDFIDYARTCELVKESISSPELTLEYNHLDFERFVPCPRLLDGPGIHVGQDHPLRAELENMRKQNTRQFGCGSAYDWQVANWNVKWNACNASKPDIYQNSEGKHVAHYEFETPWDTPTPVFQAMTKMFPRLHFEVSATEEGGCWPPFTEHYEAGQLGSREEHPHEPNDDEA